MFFAKITYNKLEINFHIPNNIIITNTRINPNFIAQGNSSHVQHRTVK